MEKVILITGSTDGIGKLAAIRLANDGHHILIHGRNPDKLNTVIAEIKSLTKNENIIGFRADFSDLNEVKQMANAIKLSQPRIDILINNAGVFKSPVSQSKEGWDIRMVVNYFAPYLLTEELFELLKAGTDPRIINLSSAAQDTVQLDILRGIMKGSARETYGQSKLALTMWSFYLAKKEPSLSVIALNPGSLLNTNMVKEAFGTFWSSADKGADIIYDLAVSEAYSGKTMPYFDNDKGTFGTAHPDAYDDLKIQNLIRSTQEMLDT